MNNFVFKDGQTVVFAGDSITDCGRRTDAKPYGTGYVSQVIGLIGARYPERNIKYFNAGIGGNTAPNLRDRWEDDVLYFKPDWVTVKIGINDLARTLNNTPDASPPDVFETAYRDILTRTRDSGAGIVLIDPFYISNDTHEGSYRKKILDFLPEYISVVHKMSEEFDTRLVRTHDLYQEQLKRFPADTFCPEPVHPNPLGHLVIAHGLLNALNW